MQEGIKKRCGWLEKPKESDFVGKGNYLWQENHWSKDPYRFIQLYWCILRSPYRHENSHRWGHLHVTSSVAQKIVGTKVKYKNLHGGWASWCELISILQFMAGDFLHGQGYGIINNIVYQYNQIAIRMEENGSNYCNENSRHIDIRCFL